MDREGGWISARAKEIHNGNETHAPPVQPVPETQFLPWTEGAWSESLATVIPCSARYQAFLPPLQPDRSPPSRQPRPTR